MYKFGCLLVVILLPIAIAVRDLLLRNGRIRLFGLLDCLVPGDVFGDAQQRYKSQTFD